MTTIIWAGRKIAADTQGSLGNFVSPMRSTKIRVVGQYVVANSGKAMCGERLIRNLTPDLEAGTLHNTIYDPKLTIPKEHFTVLFIHLQSGDALVWNGHNENWDFMASPYVMGSGGAVALGAYLAGASLENAVKIAASQDTGTNDIVDIIEWDEKGIVRQNGVRVISGELTTEHSEEYAETRGNIFDELSRPTTPTANSWDPHDIEPIMMDLQWYWPAVDAVSANDIIYGEDFAVVISKYNDPLAAARDMGMLIEKYGKGVCVTSRPSPHCAYVGVRTSRQLADQIMAACEWHKTDNRLNVEYRRP